MLPTNLACCHVPALKFRFTAAPDGKHGDAVICFQRHPGADLGAAILRRPLDITGDPARLQAFLVLGEPGVEPLWQLGRDAPNFSDLSHGWGMNPADRSSWNGELACLGSQPWIRASRMLAAT
ncbi:hypothetical protein [Streptomyces sp. NBC_01477]|uniref:hypothetical protein n=1 Tax=Streptomyces sp. NBC_01477 TaxID=2976015 RepID=UPI002E3365EE|nr:hypothetical protein [Streptomyces sp. NBC_01477]